MDDKIKGLNLGADDYLSKPFSFGRTFGSGSSRSLVRRNAGQKKTVLESRGIRLDLLKHEVTLDDEMVLLTQREFALLEFFMQIPARVLTRTQIAEQIWDCHFRHGNPISCGCLCCQTARQITSCQRNRAPLFHKAFAAWVINLHGIPLRTSHIVFYAAVVTLDSHACSRIGLLVHPPADTYR